MSKILKKPSLREYDEGHEDKPQIVPMSLIETGERIDQLLENKPKTRDRHVWREWKKSVNQLVNIYNEKCGTKAYKNVG